MTHNLAQPALAAAPPFPHAGSWTPCTYTHDQRGAAAGDIANAIRLGAFMLTAEERAQLAAELLTHASTDRPRDSIFGEPV